MSWAEIKKAVNNDLDIPLNEQLEQYEIDGRRCFKKVLLRRMPTGMREDREVSNAGALPIEYKLFNVDTYTKNIAVKCNNVIYIFGSFFYYTTTAGNTTNIKVICVKHPNRFITVALDYLYATTQFGTHTNLYSDNENLYIMPYSDSVSNIDISKLNPSTRNVTAVRTVYGINAGKPSILADGVFYLITTVNTSGANVFYIYSIDGSLTRQQSLSQTGNYYDNAVMVSLGDYVYVISPNNGSKTQCIRYAKSDGAETTMPNVPRTFNTGFGLTYNDEIHLFISNVHYKGDGSEWTQLANVPQNVAVAYIAEFKGEDKIVCESDYHTYVYDETNDTWDEVFICEPITETYVYDDGTAVS